MGTSITLTRRCVPLARRTNIAGLNIFAHVDFTMKKLPLFGELKGISKSTAFLKDGLAKYDFSAR